MTASLPASHSLFNKKQWDNLRSYNEMYNVIWVFWRRAIKNCTSFCSPDFSFLLSILMLSFGCIFTPKIEICKIKFHMEQSKRRNISLDNFIIWIRSKISLCICVIYVLLNTTKFKFNSFLFSFFCFSYKKLLIICGLLEAIQWKRVLCLHCNE